MMKRKASTAAIMYAVLLLFLVIWIFPVVTAVIKSLSYDGFASYTSVISNKDAHYVQVVANSFFIALATSIIIALITSLAGCGSSEQEAAATKDDPVTITFWTWQSTDAQWKILYNKFEEENLGIKIDWWRTSELADYQKKLQTAMAGSEGQTRLVCKQAVWSISMDDLLTI